MISRFKILISMTIGLFVVMIIDNSIDSFNVPEMYILMFGSILTLGYPVYFKQRSDDKKNGVAQ